MSCEPAELQRVRLHVYQRGSVKDIRAVRHDGSVLCSAYSETLEFDQAWASRDEMHAAAQRHGQHPPVPRQPVLQRRARRDEGHRPPQTASRPSSASTPTCSISCRPNCTTTPRSRSNSTMPKSSPGRAAPMKARTATRSASPLLRPLSAAHCDPRRTNAFQLEQRPCLASMTVGGLLGLAFGLLIAQSSGATTPPPRSSARSRRRIRAVSAADLQPQHRRDRRLRSRWRAGGVPTAPSFRRRASFPHREQRLIAALTWQIMATTLNSLQPLMKHDKTFKVSFNVDPLHFLSPRLRRRPAPDRYRRPRSHRGRSCSK